MFHRRHLGWQACGFLHWLLNSVSPSLLPLPLCCFFFLHIIFRLVSFRPGGAAPPHTVPGWCGQGVPIHSQVAAAPPPGAHTVSAPAAERTGPAAPGDPAAAPAVPGEAQATVPAAAAAPQQGGSAQLPSLWDCLPRARCHMPCPSADLEWPKQGRENTKHMFRCVVQSPGSCAAVWSCCADVSTAFLIARLSVSTLGHSCARSLCSVVWGNPQRDFLKPFAK